MQTKFHVTLALCLLAGAAAPLAAQDQPERQPGRPDTQPSTPMSERSRPIGQPGMSEKSLLRRAEGPKVSGDELSRATQGWDKKNIEALKKLTDKYGMPSTAGPDVVVWHHNGPWLQTTVYSGQLEHHFPIKHVDFLEQSIAYEVPADKFDELAEFDGSIIVDRTRGTIAARCDKEENNILALNLAHDVITGKKDVKQARDEYARIALQAVKAGPDAPKPPYMAKFQFEPQRTAMGFADQVHPDAQAAGILAAPEEPPMKDDMPPPTNRPTDPPPRKPQR
jgi:hypothetical protein